MGMKKKGKINLAVVFYGNKEQLGVNNQQFKELKNLLTSFELSKYDFNNNEDIQLLEDFNNNKIDVVLKNSYGRANENDVENFLEKNKIPFMGSGSKTTILGTSKFLSKQIFVKHKLLVAKDVFIDKIKWQTSKNKILKKVEKDINYPCVVKDVAGTDSRGLYFVKNKEECIQAVNKIINKDSDLIIEKYIKADEEVTCMVVGNKKSSAYEPVSIGSGDLFDTKKKDAIAFKMNITSSLSQVLIDKVKKISVKAHQVLGCNTFSRADILIKNNNIYLLEVDVHPGFRTKSPTFLSAKHQSETPDELFLKFYKLVVNK
jgi:D-alanine-D-alanine ligase